MVCLLLSMPSNLKVESPTAYSEGKPDRDARSGKGSHGPPSPVAQPVMSTESHSFFRY